MRCGGGAVEGSNMLTQQTGGAAENSKMLTQQTGRGDRWLRGAGGDPVAGDRGPVTGDPPALPPSPGGAPGEGGRRPSACPRRGRRPPAPAHAEETGLVDMDMDMDMEPGLGSARCC